jgi:nucleotide-binding universal stress UspA family protein
MKILVAYDGSSGAQRALERTVQISSALSDGKAEVTVISVVPLQASGPRSAGPVATSDVEEHGRELDEAVEKLKGLGVEAKTIEAAGHIAGSIVDEADRGGFDLIVIGASGHHTVERFVGSTTTRVVSHAHCDVLVVR